MHCGQTLAVSTLSFCCDRRWSRRRWEVFFLGTGMVTSPQVNQTRHCTTRPSLTLPRAVLRIGVEVGAADRAQAAAVLAAEQLGRQGLGDQVAHPALHVDLVRDDVASSSSSSPRPPTRRGARTRCRAPPRPRRRRRGSAGTAPRRRSRRRA